MAAGIAIDLGAIMMHHQHHHLHILTVETMLWSKQNKTELAYCSSMHLRTICRVSAAVGIIKCNRAEIDGDDGAGVDIDMHM